MFTLVLFDFTLWLVQKTRWKLLNGKKTSALQLRQKGFLLPSPSPRQLTSPKLDLSGPDLYVEKLTNQTRQDLLLPYLWNLLFAKIVGTRDIKDQWQLLSSLQHDLCSKTRYIPSVWTISGDWFCWTFSKIPFQKPELLIMTSTSNLLLSLYVGETFRYLLHTFDSQSHSFDAFKVSRTHYFNSPRGITANRTSCKQSNYEETFKS